MKWTKNLGKGGSGEESIRNIIRAVQEELKKIENEGREPASLLIKLGPDMTMKEKEEMANVALETGVHGLIVSNTSSRRPSDLKCSSKTERGGKRCERQTHLEKWRTRKDVKRCVQNDGG